MRPSTLPWTGAAQGIGGLFPPLTKLALGGLAPFTPVVVRRLLGALILLGVTWVALRRAWREPGPGAAP